MSRSIISSLLRDVQCFGDGGLKEIIKLNSIVLNIPIFFQKIHTDIHNTNQHQPMPYCLLLQFVNNLEIKNVPMKNLIQGVQYGWDE